MREEKYIVRAYTNDDMNRGFDDEAGRDTLREAKATAKYFLSDSYLQAIESTVPVKQVTITLAESGECVEHFFAR